METLITPEKEREVFAKLKEYYEKIYGIFFFTEERVFTNQEIGEIYYTYPGPEAEATFSEYVSLIKKLIPSGYNTPAILLQKGDSFLILDGHRRLKAAWDLGISWPCLILKQSSPKFLEIEKNVVGKIKYLWGKD
ncbi:MAG: hypothetical protein QW097_02040 [archaeon]